MVNKIIYRRVLFLAKGKISNSDGTIFSRIVKKKDKDGNIREYEYWTAEFTIGYDEKGERKKKTISGKSKKEVAAKKRDYITKRDNGELPLPNEATFKSWLYNYLHKHKKLVVKPTTFDKYETLSRVHIYDSAIGNMRIQKLTPDDIRDFIAEKAEKLAPKTVRELHLILRMALEQAVDDGKIAKNIAIKIALPRIEQKAVEPLTDEEISNLLYVLKNWNTTDLAKEQKRPFFKDKPQEHWLYPAILLELGTGIRRGELLALKWKNVNFDNNSITITESLVKTRIATGKKDEKKTVNIFQEPKTKASIRNITVPVQIMDKLKAHKEANNSPEFVFTQQSDKTKPITPRHFSRTFETICEKAGLKTTRFHDMRHTYASQQLALNTHMKVVQAQLGHTDIKTTLNRYSHLTQGLQQEAADKLNDKFKSFI